MSATRVSFGQFTRREVPTVGEHTTSRDALARLQEFGFGPVLVLNSVGVVLGTVLHDQLEAAPNGARVDRLLRFGVTTVRPSEEVGALASRMLDKGLSRVVVTRADGTLVGLFFAGDAPAT